MTRIVFLDTETTHLDPSTGGLVSMAMRVWNDGDVTAKYDRLIVPWGGATITPEACRVNGYHPTEWAQRGATPLTLADVKEWHSWLGGAVVGGSNVPFDKGFIAAECVRLGGQAPRWSHRNADTNAMAFPLVAAGMIENAGLAALAAYFGVEHAKPHDAGSDVDATVAVFEALCDLYLFKPAAWREGLREVAAFSSAGAGAIARRVLSETGQALPDTSGSGT